VGAVNTVVIDRDAEGRVELNGHNTDVAGFLDSLREGGFDPGDGGKAVVVGAGGAARAVVYGLLGAGMAPVVVLNRTAARAEALIADLEGLEAPPGVARGRGHLEAGGLSPDALAEATGDAALLVNATTVGMWPKITESVWPDDLPFPADLTVYDLVYNPLETALLRQARAVGARAIDGLGMLARQGALALAYWVDRPLDVAATAREMRGVCEAALLR
jgi:shikimate dehydrogenase